jgi:hypothetical protein
MPQKLLIAFSIAVFGACARRSNESNIALVQDERCTAVADTVSKYVSEDALPQAHLIGEVSLRPPAIMQPGDSVEVEFVVFPNGYADTSSVIVSGASDPQFISSAVLFAARNRFTPAQVSGCNVVSRYSVVMRPGGATHR